MINHDLSQMRGNDVLIHGQAMLASDVQKALCSLQTKMRQILTEGNVQHLRKMSDEIKLYHKQANIQQFIQDQIINPHYSAWKMTDGKYRPIPFIQFFLDVFTQVDAPWEEPVFKIAGYWLNKLEIYLDGTADGYIHKLRSMKSSAINQKAAQFIDNFIQNFESELTP